MWQLLYTVAYNANLFQFQFVYHQTYYYNAKTRESAWIKPEGATLITQTEIEAMAAAQQHQQPSAAAQQQSATVAAAQQRGFSGANPEFCTDEETLGIDNGSSQESSSSVALRSKLDAKKRSETLQMFNS